MRLGRLGYHGTLTGTLLFVMNVFKRVKALKSCASCKCEGRQIVP